MRTSVFLGPVSTIRIRGNNGEGQDFEIVLRCGTGIVANFPAMKSMFYIELNLKTLKGFERYACFDLGSNRNFAVTLFSELEGEASADEAGVLHMDLVEKRNGLPVNVRVISCTVDQLSRNVKHITREIFKSFNLDETIP